jgi:hypothetical protein
MWRQYRKTLWATQLVILLITGFIVIWSRVLGLGALFFCVMQLGAAVGALWATRLRSKFQ